MYVYKIGGVGVVVGSGGVCSTSYITSLCGSQLLGMYFFICNIEKLGMGPGNKAINRQPHSECKSMLNKFIVWSNYLFT